MKKLLITLGILSLPLIALATTAFNSPQLGSSASNGYVLQTNGTVNTWVSTSTLGIKATGSNFSTTSINGLASTTFTFATTTTGTDFSISTTSSLVNFNLPTASGSNRGALSSTDWTTFNNKQAAGSYLTSVSADSPLSGSGTSGSHLTVTSGYNIPLTASTSNWDSGYKQTSALFIVSSSTATGNFTDIQTALNAIPSTGGTVLVKAGIYTVSNLQIKQAGTILRGEGIGTKLQFSSGNGIGFVTTGLTNVYIEDLWLHGSGTYAGIGINASNTPLLYVDRVKIDNTATSTSLIDSANLTFYQTWTNLDLRDNTSCIDIGGNPVNDNLMINVRCGPTSGRKGTGLYMTSSNINGAQNWTFTNFDVEPTGAGTGLTALYLPTAVDVNFISPYIEGNATAYNIGANSQRINFIGGEFVSNTTYTNSGQNTQFLNTDKEGVAYNYLAASTTIQDRSGNDAGTPSLYLTNNGSGFAKAKPFILVESGYNTDSTILEQISNQGTGTTTQIKSSDTSDAIGPVLETVGPSAKSSTKGTCFSVKATGTSANTYFYFTSAGAMVTKTTTCGGAGTTTVQFN